MTVKTAKKTVKKSKLKKKAQRVSGAVMAGASQGKLSYVKIAKGSAKQLTINKNTGKITVRKKTKKGTFKIKVRVTAAGDANCLPASKVVTVKIEVK